MKANEADALESDGSVRLDKWLWASRFYRTRSLAAAAVDAGQVRVNGERVKPAKALRADDHVVMRIGGQEREVVVRLVASLRASAGIAQARYAETEVSVAAREAEAARRRLEREPAHTRKGRPTKRDRRELDTFVARDTDSDGF